jgi:hypothetical protein
MNKYYLLFFLLLGSITLAISQTTTEVVSGMVGAYGLAAYGNEMYVSDRFGDKLYKFDYTSATPTLIEVATISVPNDLTVVGNYLYITTGSFLSGTGIYRMDLSAPTPMLETVYSTADRTNGPTIIGDELYFADPSINAIRKLDLTEMPPTPTTVVSGLARPQGLTFYAGLLYILETDGARLSSFDPTEMSPSTSFVASVTTPLGVARNGSFLYIVGGSGNGLRQVNLNQDPATVSVVPGIGINDPKGSLFVNGVLYITDGGRVVKVEGLPASFSLPTVCNDEAIATLGGASPTGGVYSGPGVTDNGNGESFTFDVAGQGLGTYTVTYTLNGANASTMFDVVAAPTVTFSTGGLSVQVDAGVQAGLSGGMPAGGVYSGNGVTDDGNGMTYSFDPAAAGEGDNVITYTFAGANGCGGAQGAVITVTAATVPGDNCDEAIDLSALFGGAVDAPQTSGLYDNSDFTTDASDPAVVAGCFFNDDPFNNTGWFSFTGDGNTYRVRSIQCTGPNANLDLQVAVYSGTCGNLTDVACNEDEDGANNIFNFNVEFDTEDGVEYLILVDGYQGEAGEFCIEVTNVTEPLPGDECADAIDINSLFGQAQMMPQLSEEYDNTGYTDSPDDPTNHLCGNNITGFNPIWFAFTGDDNTYTINSTGGFDLIATLYSGECGNLTALVCNDDDVALNFGLEIQTEVGVDYLLIASSANGGSGAFNIEVTNQGSVGVTNISETALRVFPNPTRGMIQLPQIDLERVEAYDATGRLVVSQQQPGTSIDLSAQPAGLYILKMYAGEEVYSAKVVKE